LGSLSSKRCFEIDFGHGQFGGMDLPGWIFRCYILHGRCSDGTSKHETPRLRNQFTPAMVKCKQRRSRMNDMDDQGRHIVCCFSFPSITSRNVTTTCESTNFQHSEAKQNSQHIAYDSHESNINEFKIAVCRNPCLYSAHSPLVFARTEHAYGPGRNNAA